MAKSKGASSNKVIFGKRKCGRATKTHNKHDRKERNYRGQGKL